MNMRRRIYPRQEVQRQEAQIYPAFAPIHGESLPNTSVVFSVSALADRDDVVATVRTAALLARSSGASLSVTVLDECVMGLQPGAPVAPSSLENSLSSIRTKLLTSGSSSGLSNFALEASISLASFLSSGSISLRVRRVDSLPHNQAFTR